MYIFSQTEKEYSVRISLHTFGIVRNHTFDWVLGAVHETENSMIPSTDRRERELY
jgi:hypothetical protein